MLLIILNLKKKKKESLWQESLEPVWEGRCLASAMREKTPPPRLFVPLELGLCACIRLF